jgi:hypothetical protein
MQMQVLRRAEVKLGLEITQNLKYEVGEGMRREGSSEV